MNGFQSSKMFKIPHKQQPSLKKVVSRKLNDYLLLLYPEK